MDNELLQLSWISNYVYCPRRFYLSVLEAQMPGSNIFMTQGTISHNVVDRPKIEKRKDIIRVTRLNVCSEKLEIYGICDCVEFTISSDGVYIPFLDEKCVINPVEYKRGKIRKETAYDVQLLCQALCIEEMFGCTIDSGDIYYTDAKHRQKIYFQEKDRTLAKKCISEMHEFINKPRNITAKYMKRCPSCSYYEVCSPKKAMVERYMKRVREKIKE